MVKVSNMDHDAMHRLNLPHVGTFPPSVLNSRLETTHADDSSIVITRCGRDRSNESDEQRAVNNNVHSLRDALEAFGMMPCVRISGTHLSACFEVSPALKMTQTAMIAPLSVTGGTRYLDRRH